VEPAPTDLHGLERVLRDAAAAALGHGPAGAGLVPALVVAALLGAVLQDEVRLELSQLLGLRDRSNDKVRTRRAAALVRSVCAYNDEHLTLGRLSVPTSTARMRSPSTSRSSLAAKASTCR
jgi:hypothetical protein